MEKQKKIYFEGCLPCTLAEIRKNSENFHSKVIKHVEVFGKLLNVQQNPFSLDLAIEDFTGKGSVLLYYLKESEKYYGAVGSLVLVEGFYYKVFGVLKEIGESVSIVASRIENVYERALINEFISRMMMVKLRILSGGVNGAILKYLSGHKENFPDGATSEALLNELNFPIETIEENLYQLVLQGSVKYGVDWDHYCISN